MLGDGSITSRRDVQDGTSLFVITNVMYNTFTKGLPHKVIELVVGQLISLHRKATVELGHRLLNVKSLVLQEAVDSGIKVAMS